MMGPGYGYGNNMMGGYGDSWFGLGLMVLFGVLLIVGVVLLIIWAVRSAGGQGSAGGGRPPGGAGHDEAVGIAKRRLAGGEINKEQYDEIMRALGG